MPNLLPFEPVIFKVEGERRSVSPSCDAMRDVVAGILNGLHRQDDSTQCSRSPEPPAGFEPAASPLGGAISSAELWRHLVQKPRVLGSPVLLRSYPVSRGFCAQPFPPAACFWEASGPYALRRCLPVGQRVAGEREPTCQLLWDFLKRRARTRANGRGTKPRAAAPHSKRQDTAPAAVRLQIQLCVTWRREGSNLQACGWLSSAR